MEEREIHSLSENGMMPDPGEEGPAPGTGSGEPETPPPEESQDPVADPDPTPGEEGQKPGENTEMPDPGEPVQDTGRGEDPRIDEILDRLDYMREQGEASDKDKSVTERLDALIELFTVDPEEESGIETHAEAFPFEGYEEWEYQIGVKYCVYPWGFGRWMDQIETYSDPESFKARYDEIVSLCADGGTLKDFYVMYIWEDYCGDWEDLVYDYQAAEPEPEPDPGEEEPDETAELLLSRLEDISTTLEEMQQADLEYYQSVAAHQDEMLKLQTADTGSTIMLCVVVFMVLGELTIKHFLEGFR